MPLSTAATAKLVEVSAAASLEELCQRLVSDAADWDAEVPEGGDVRT